MTSELNKDRIGKILKVLKKAADGDYSTKLDFASKNDELGRIAGAVNTLLKKTSKRLSSARQTSTDQMEDAVRNRNILDSIQESYYEVDLKGNLLFFNDAVVQELGYTNEDVRGINFHQFVDEANAQKIYEIFHKVFLTGQTVKSFDWEIFNKNKEIIDVESSVALLRNEKGKPVGFRGTVRVITQRKQAERDLRQSEEKYRSILDIMGEGYIEDDLNGRITFVNDAACRLWGYKREQLIGMHYSDYLSPAVAQKIYDVFHKVYETGKPELLVDYDIRHRNGSIKTYQMNVALRYDSSGKPCGFRILTRDVTLRKQAQEALRQSEERYRNILENMEEIYLETDLKGHFIFFNDSLCRVLGYSREKLQNINYHLVIPSNQAQNMFEMFNEIYRTGKTKTFLDYAVIAKDGSIRYMEMSVSLMRLPTGEPIGFNGIGRDVTQRLKAQRNIQERERHLRLITDNIRDIIWTMDFDMHYTYLSSPVLRITGFTPEEMTKIPLKSVMSSATYAMFEQTLAEEMIKKVNRESKDERRNMTFEMQIMSKNGKPIWIEISADFNRDENGTPFEIVGVTRDITERKQAEEIVKESEKRYRMIVENMHEAVLKADLNLQFTYISPSSLWLTGYTTEEIAKIPLNKLLTADSFTLAQNTVAEELAREFSGEPVDIFRSRTIEQELYHKKGGTVWLEMTATFIRDENSKPTGILMAGRDITARKRAEEEKNKLEKQLMQAQKMETVGRLAGGVAHDFNNMLSVILGYVDLAKLRLAKQHPVLKDIEEIEKAALRSRDITTQLLAFSRKQIIAPKIIDLNDLVTHTQKALIRLIGEDVELKVRLEANLWPIKFDPAQIEQILMNLAVNARDAMSDTGKLTIETTNIILDDSYCENHVGFTPGHYVRLSFSDNGAGMDKEVLQHIFEPFFTTKEAGKGTGLGLATVYGIVKQNNSFINVYSEPGHGTTFSLYLRSTTEKREAQKKSEEEPTLTGTGNILLVEDDPMVLEITKGMLESIGYVAMVAENPLDAISLCENPATSIDLVITDVVMPTMSGKELRDKLINIRPELKVLFMSGYTADVIAHHGVLEKGVQFIQKPFSINALACKVSEAMAAKPR